MVIIGIIFCCVLALAVMVGALVIVFVGLLFCGLAFVLYNFKKVLKK